MGGMLETLRNALKIPDLRKKIMMTIGMLLIYRIGAHVPVPGYDPDLFKQMIEKADLGIANMMNIISGGAFKTASIFAMSITPYINASIIMQLLTVAIPQLERMQKEGEEGRKKIQMYVRYGTVILGFIQAVGLYFTFRGALVGDQPTLLSFFTITLSFTAGTAFLMWLGEKINDVGIGNGISLLIFGGIISRAPDGVEQIIKLYNMDRFGKGILGGFGVAGFLLVFLVVIAGVVFVQQAERKIPVQYAKKVVGRKVYGGQNTHIPIKVNSAGVIPIIFAMSIMMFPGTLVKLFAGNSEHWFVNGIKKALAPDWYVYPVLFALLIMFFTFFYTIMVFNPVELANNLKKNGGFIPGIRPGKPTSDYISKILNRVTWFNAFFLALISVLPSILGLITKIGGIWFAGTGLLIIVGVALDTVKQIESQMLMRHYKGFLE